MYGEKQQQSGYACAVIEEAVRGIYPLKVINFSTSGQVVHYVVKEFDDKTKRNCSYSFAAKRSFSGGNKDGYSIRQCTEELLRRKEPNKFLIVLSDGAPSDYESHEAAINDVKSAVAYARSHKIDVTSIFFGSVNEREREIDLYNEMYGAGHIISCEPEAIVNHLIKIVKKNIFR
jgi:nitric oxide reductase activation protein